MGLANDFLWCRATENKPTLVSIKFGTNCSMTLFDVSNLHTACDNSFHDDVIKWKHFPRYWPFVRGNHRSPVGGFPHKGQWHGAFICFFDLRPNKRLSKQSRCRWPETPSRLSWRHCDDYAPVTHMYICVCYWIGPLFAQKITCRLLCIKSLP